MGPEAEAGFACAGEVTGDTDRTPVSGAARREPSRGEGGTCCGGGGVPPPARQGARHLGRDPPLGHCDVPPGVA